LVSALEALKDESDTGTMAIVCSVGGKEKILLKLSGNYFKKMQLDFGLNYSRTGLPTS